MISATPERGYDKALTKRIQRSYKKKRQTPARGNTQAAHGFYILLSNMNAPC
jgi:hypothetical protein